MVNDENSPGNRAEEANGGWVVRLIVPPDDRGDAPAVIDLVSSLLWDAGTTGIAEDGARLLAGFDDRASARAAAERAAAGWPVVIEAVEPVRWTGSDQPATVPVGRPTGPSTDLRIVAGRAFGHGSHPTTALALELLTSVAGPGRAVLDVGTGTGVLALAAATLGADPVVGIDIDPEAVAVAAANARANGVDVTISTTPIEGASDLIGGRRFDVVVANVLLPTQRRLARAMSAALAPGGTLITTGYLTTDGDEIRRLHDDALDQAGHGPVPAIDTTGRDGWLAHRFGPGPGGGPPTR